MRVTIPTLLFAIAMLVALSGQGQAQQQSVKPAYCSGPGAYRLSECGLTERQALEAEAAAAAAGAVAPSDRLSRDDINFLFRSMSREAKKLCDRPISAMSMDDIEDCNKPGMRLLRER